jgi:hypothetical protein
VYVSLISLLVILALLLAYPPGTQTTIDTTPSEVTYEGFTITINCTLPDPPEKMNKIDVGTIPVDTEKILQLAANVFEMSNISSILYEEDTLIIVSGNKTLYYYPTDYIRYDDESVDRDKVVEVNQTKLLALGDGFIQFLYEHWEKPVDTELRYERTEYPDLNLSSSGEWVSDQPQYIVYYHYINGTPTLALNAEFNLGFADGKIAYAQISRIHIVNMTSVEISKTPVEALTEAFPGAQLSGGIGVGSRATVPTSGQIIVEDMRLFYYNWHGARGRKLGESYELLPYYRIKALLSGPDERLIHQEIRVNVEIMAIDDH